MAIRTLHLVIRVADADPARTPTEAECLVVIGADRWETARNGARPQNGAYLVGYQTDLGRRGDERDARGAQHAQDTGFKGRPREAPPGGGGGGGGRDGAAPGKPTG
ncbi:hypothetical protein [Sorangium sp. So ce388]|uniref:hypothetical protein n=1 Tax=Sorangium sp. So ce388 TaxID=3133309 RepID=UPI003F5C3D0C